MSISQVWPPPAPQVPAAPKLSDGSLSPWVDLAKMFLVTGPGFQFDGTGTLVGKLDKGPIINTGQFIQGFGGYDPVAMGIPNVAAAGNLDFGYIAGGIYSDNTASRNRFQVASYVFNDQNQPTVARFNMGKGMHVWGENTVGYSAGAGHTAIGDELDYGNVGNATGVLSGDHTLPITQIDMVSTTGAAASGIAVFAGRFFRYTGIAGNSLTGVTFESGANSGTVLGGTGVTYSVGGTSTGLAIVAIGGNVGGSPPGPYIQCQSQTASQATFGWKIQNSGQPAVWKLGDLIQAAAEDCVIGIDFIGSKFSTAAAYLPVDSGSTTASFGLLLQAEGGFANAGNFIDIRASGAGSSAAHGIIYRLSGGIQPITGDLVRVSGAVSCANGFNISSAIFSGAAFILGAAHNFQFDTVTGTKFGTGTTQKLSFWNAAPVAKPAAITGSRAGNAALADLLTKLASTGLITDSTTA